MKRHIKPFTLFLYIMILGLIAFGTKIYILDIGILGQEKDNEIDERSPWTGIISLWDITYIETGTGTNHGWLSNRVRDFERQNPGVFIDVRRLEPQRADLYIRGGIATDILPDIISISPYEDTGVSSLYQELEPFFTKDELEKILPLARDRVLRHGRLWGIPTMLGTYAIFINLDILEEMDILVEDDIGDNKMDFDALNTIVKRIPHLKKEGKKELQVFGFGSYDSPHSKPILGLVYDDSINSIKDSPGYRYLREWSQVPGLVQDDLAHMDSKASLKQFIDERRIGVFLGNTRAIYKNRTERSKGKGFEMGVYNIPGNLIESPFQDQVAAYGIVKKEDSQKIGYCVAFLKSLLSPESQGELNKIGMFPIIDDIGYIYEEDFDMLELEKTMKHFREGPWNGLFDAEDGSVERLIQEIIPGNLEGEE